ncbi:MAG TPA: ferritin-like domain-containing protein [Solirubrobacteraceae bacterium]|nr:ferritin-like domain-containing protein [Solirubrobacteraceae bacterium]
MTGCPDRTLTRRELVSRAAAAAVWAAGAGAVHAGTAEAAAPQTDAELLRAILSVELLVVFSYEQVLGSGKLSPSSEHVIRPLLDHEHMHVDVVSAELEELGQAPPDPPASVAAADAELSVLHGSARLASLNSEQDCLRLLEQVESLAQGAYYVSMSKLADVHLARLCASILGAEAQHYTALAGLLHPGDINKAVPGPFVEGSA